MSKIVAIAVAFILSGCAANAINNSEDVISKSSYLEMSIQDLENEIVGIWAMVPLRNGTANVIEFNSDNTGYVHGFKCDFDNGKVISGGVEKNSYQISDGVISITRDGHSEPYTSLRVNGIRRQPIASNPAIDAKSLSLSQIIEIGDMSHELNFNYMKILEVLPLCAMSNIVSQMGEEYACDNTVDCIFKILERTLE